MNTIEKYMDEIYEDMQMKRERDKETIRGLVTLLSKVNSTSNDIAIRRIIDKGLEEIIETFNKKEDVCQQKEK